MRVITDAALGDGWELIGARITDAGLEDSSGLRRCIAGLLSRCDIDGAAKALHCNLAQAKSLWADLVAVWGNPNNGRPNDR